MSADDCLKESSSAGYPRGIPNRAAVSFNYCPTNCPKEDTTSSLKTLRLPTRY